MCRKPLTGDDASQRPPLPPPQHRSRTGVWATDNIETELLFRLNSLQRCATLGLAGSLPSWGSFHFMLPSACTWAQGCELLP